MTARRTAGGQVAASKVSRIHYYSLEQATAAAWRAVKRANDPRDPDQFLFRHGDRLCRLEFNDAGRLVPRALTADRMRYRLSETEVATWVTLGKGGEEVPVKTGAPSDVVRNVLASPNPDLPIVTRIVEVPVIAQDGSVHSKPGYNRKSRAFLHPPESLAVPTIRPRPSGRDVKRARDLIMREVFGDFPFVSDAEKAHALCLLLQPFVRDLIAGPTPLFVAESPTPGTGKTLLVDVACYPAVGGPMKIMTAPGDEGEWRKQITSCLLESPPVIFIDNVQDSLSSAALSAALTAREWSDRRLGKSEQLTVPNMATWVTAGNNPGFSGEMLRRSVRSRIDARMEHPEDRRTFRHNDLRGWVRDHRGELIWAALTLARAWVAKGKPRSSTSLGSFEEWAAVMGGILDVAEVPGFLGNQEGFREHARAENHGMYELLSELRATFGDFPFTARELARRAYATLERHLGIDTSGPTANVKIGIELAKHRDRQYADLVLVHTGKPGGVQHWAVQEVVADDE